MTRKVFSYTLWSLVAILIGGSVVAAPRMFTSAFLVSSNINISKLNFDNRTTKVELPEILEETSEVTPPKVLTRTLAAMSFAIPKEGQAILADLGEMTLKRYENGEVRVEYPILSKGKPGSLWETPTGSYQIKTKEENHYSTIGNVWMPWSMQFFGNFFIHGWPYYEGGSPVSPGFSGGCIRLSEKDAQELFNQVTRATPVFVTNG
ncbi:MAG: L,D-transpeptidase, partial [Candidatus Colwellbacteria bacterium]|nr:L,D-transpeptidase [Candidatus Colwellbacteria bacterium]